MNDYEKRAKDACIAIVENVADAFKARRSEATEFDLHDVLDMAKFVAADRDGVNSPGKRPRAPSGVPKENYH